MKSRPMFVTLGMLILFSLPTAGAPAPVAITLESVSPYYQPAVATVFSEMPIQWRNPTASPHSITHDACLGGEVCEFNSGAVRPDETYTITGLHPGKYSYHCELHPIMRGVLIVIDPPARMSSDRRSPTTDFQNKAAVLGELR